MAGMMMLVQSLIFFFIIISDPAVLQLDQCVTIQYDGLKKKKHLKKKIRKVLG